MRRQHWRSSFYSSNFRRPTTYESVALKRFICIYPGIPLSLLLSRGGYTAETACNIGHQRKPAAFQRTFYTGHRRGIFKAPPAPPRTEFHGIPLILCEINTDTWLNYEESRLFCSIGTPHKRDIRNRFLSELSVLVSFDG